MTALGPIFHDLVRFQIVVWNAVDARLRADHDLPLGQFEFMGVMASHPLCRVNDIAEELVITVGGASKLVDRIEAAGRCERQAHPDDGRSSVLVLTSKGESDLAAATVTFENELARLFGALSSSAVASLGTSLSRLRHPAKAGKK